MADDAKAKALAAKEEGNELYKQKKFDEALQCYATASQLDPSDMTFLTNRAAAFFEKKDFQSCIDECQKAVEVGRENKADFKIIAKAFARMGNAYAKLEDYENAKLCFEKSLTEHRTPETRTLLSNVEKVLNDKKRLEYINPAISLQEKEKGNECFKKGDYPQALKCYTEAIKRNPDDAKLYSNRAACYQKLAEFPSALKDAEDCIRLEPGFIKGHTRKGLALLAMKEFSRASTAFQKALEIDPNNAEALEAYRKCLTASNSNPDEVRRQALADPEIQQILGDPAMRLILEQMQSDPRAVQEHLRNPEVAIKIEKLIEAGLIGMR